MKNFLVVGSGIAGMTTALEAAKEHRVTLLTKATLSQSNTRYAQGGIAAVTSGDDSVQLHTEDTLTAGAGLSEEYAARALCAGGGLAIDELLGRGVPFDRVDGELSGGLEAAHSYPRILHAGGDATGAGISDALIERLRRSTAVIHESTTVKDLLLADGVVTGVELVDGSRLHADVVVLATGGAGQLFPCTTNPDVATGDGVAIALRAGAVVADLEFYQFHPTSLDAPGNFLVSEAVRGEGAVLIDAEGRRFMQQAHPDAELAPRDVVARAIARQTDRQSGVAVRLDATALGAEFLVRRFPNIDAASRRQGFQWAREAIPITPAAHYWMGGVRTDEWGRTSLPGLYAVGEVACNGLHGANRLASNSLLEGAVYAKRLVRAIDEPPEHHFWGERWPEPVRADLADAETTTEFTRADLQELMWKCAGLTRTSQSLQRAAQLLRSWSAPSVSDAKSAEDANLLVVARAFVALALMREESRGGHFRADYPDLLPHARHSCLKELSC